jgi:hypothetical protein
MYVYVCILGNPNLPGFICYGIFYSIRQTGKVTRTEFITLIPAKKEKEKKLPNAHSCIAKSLLISSPNHKTTHLSRILRERMLMLTV